MRDDIKKDLDRAARGFLGASLRMVAGIEQINGAAVTLGKSTLALGSELVRPVVPLLDAGTLILDGCAGAYGWTAERLGELAEQVVVVTARAKVARDAAGEAPIEEIGAAVMEAEKELSPPAPEVADEDTAPASGVKPDPGMVN